MESRFTDLEIRLTHQEAALEEINDVLLQQHALIETLRAEVTALQRQIREMAPVNLAAATDETLPPHY